MRGCLGPRAEAAGPRLQSLAGQVTRHLGPEDPKAGVNDLLRMAATPNPADPRRTIHLAASMALFSGYPGEGMQLSVDLLLVQRWGLFARVDTCPVYLRRYGSHAKAVLPQLQELRQRRTEALFKKCMDEIETTTEAPPLMSLQEFIEKAGTGGNGSTAAKPQS